MTTRPTRRPFLTLTALLWLAGCASQPPVPPPQTAAAAAQPAGERRFTILAINDVYRIEGVDGGEAGGMARLASLRQELEREAPDLLLLHAGDFLFPSLLSREYRGAQMVDVLNSLDGEADGFDERMFVTFGNHEFDREGLNDAPMLDERIEESQFRWLGSNVTFRQGDDGAPLVAAPNLVANALVTSGGVRVGLFSLTIDIAHPEYVTSFGDPVEVARQQTAELRRQGAEVVVALTHLEMAEDVEVLRSLGDDGPDLVLGGHEHNKQTQEVGGRRILKADADLRTATVVQVTLAPGAPPEVEYAWRTIDTRLAEDPQVEARVESWLQQLDDEYCYETLELPPGCLSDVLGRTLVRLVGEELEIRRFETNLGNWIADQARTAFAPYGAQIALLNSGSLRLNQDVPPGEVTRRHVEEIFAYSSELRLLRIDGATLARALTHAVTDWTGQGKFLQVAGVAFRHDPKAVTADRLTLLGPDGPRPIRAEEELLVVVPEYLVHPSGDQDGYKMFTLEQVVEVENPVPPLKDLVVSGLEAQRAAGIAPQVEGRICNSTRPGPCLAVAPADAISSSP